MALAPGNGLKRSGQRPGAHGTILPMRLPAVLALVLIACGDNAAPTDASMSPDARLADAAVCEPDPVDAAPDALPDATADAQVDAAVSLPIDAGTDADVDADPGFRFPRYGMLCDELGECPDGMRCYPTVTNDDPWWMGICSHPCTVPWTQAQCPDTALCIADPWLERLLCYWTCTSDEDCSPGVYCIAANETFSLCSAF